ncbi:hypothetical protein [Caulobacter sp. S45]|uniref:hypothetical protein n=1 Tax=Caulobacter sp. S45 TaxID=1641861 RepID=UPI001575997A|nr:hypothetical protein [Caulobacter sp. S45]
MAMLNMTRRFDVLSLTLTALSGAAWGGLVALGLEGLKGVVEQHVPGYPASGQIIYYFLMPVTAFLISFLSGVFCLKMPRVRWAGQLILLILLLGLLPFLFLYTGGV